jgi:hypothetical protein
VKKSGNKKRTLLEIPYTERDVLIAYTVFIKKYVLTTQIWKLFFSHTQNQKVCQQRMRKLCDYGILRAIEQATKRGESRKPHILALGEMGGELMIQERGVPAHLINTTPYANEESNQKIKHILAITDFQICVQESCTARLLTLEVWLEDKEIRHLRTPETALMVGPDGQAIKLPIADVFFVIKQANARGMWHAEIDRVTEDITHSTYERQSIIGKILEYLAWEQSDQYRQEFGKRPLRALFVTIGERRLRNMLKAVEKLMKQRVQLPDVEPEDEARKKEYQEKLAAFRWLVRHFPMTTFTRISTHNVITDPVWWIAGQDTPQTLLE